MSQECSRCQFLSKDPLVKNPDYPHGDICWQCDLWVTLDFARYRVEKAERALKEAGLM